MTIQTTGGKVEAEFSDGVHRIVQIDSSHHEVHEGESFRSFVVDTTLASAETLSLAFKTPPSPDLIHLVVEFITNGDAHVELLQAPTWTANQSDTTAPIQNARRGERSSFILENTNQAGFVASDVMIVNATGLSGGTAIDTTYTFTANTGGQGGGRDNEEWVLLPDTQYAVVLTSDEASNGGQIKLAWYEHSLEIE